MKKVSYTTVLIGLITTNLFAQLQLDKPLDLTGSGSDAKVTGIKNVSDPKDAVSAEILQSGSLVYATSAGAATAYTLTLAPVLTQYTTGMEVRFKAHLNNAAGPVTLNVNTLGAIVIKKDVNVDLAANDIKAGQLVTVAYDGSNMQLISRTTFPVVDNLPSGAVMYFNLPACPTGWSDLATAQGRYIVGLPAGGTLAGTTGTALTNLENRPVGQHNHTFTGNALAAHTHGTTGYPSFVSAVFVGGGTALNGGGGAFNISLDASTAGTSAGTPSGTIGNSGGVAGTNAPYIQLRVCQKN